MNTGRVGATGVRPARVAVRKVDTLETVFSDTKALDNGARPDSQSLRTSNDLRREIGHELHAA